ncbi:MAG: hypothetical protein DHS20C16_29870 [Phycisphaerae bacterium]|nr:MAG: hypothetical protein DHS20C16_29870 [Phycisphaerae bacterium]
MKIKSGSICSGNQDAKRPRNNDELRGREARGNTPITRKQSMEIAKQKKTPVAIFATGAVNVRKNF